VSHVTHAHTHDDEDALVAAQENLPAGRSPRGLAARMGIGAIRFYQRFISPMLPPSCRYTPTCSQYTLTAIRRYGFVRGVWMGVKRISRCHPFHPGGHDPVP